MALEDVLGSLVQLPVAYGNMYSNAYSPMYSYGQSMGAQSANLYGALAGQQADMYRAELPMQMEAQKWNAIAPLLGGLLGQYGIGGGSLGQLSFQSQRPDLMSGYNNAIGRYDGWMKDYFNQQQAQMPTLPKAQPTAAPAPPPPPPPQPSYTPGYGGYQGGGFQPFAGARPYGQPGRSK